MIKKVISILSVLIMLLFISCASSQPEADDTKDEKTAVEAPVVDTQDNENKSDSEQDKSESSENTSVETEENSTAEDNSNGTENTGITENTDSTESTEADENLSATESTGTTENTDIADLNSYEIYNYYKLYKSSVSGNITDKIISLLKVGKNFKIFYNSKIFVYKEKCKKKLEEEYANSSNFNENKNNLILKNDDFDLKNTINIYFSTMVSNNRYKLTVSKDLQFIKAIHKLFNNYPELEEKKISCFISQGDRINLFDTIEENKLNENSLILMIDKQK